VLNSTASAAKGQILDDSCSPTHAHVTSSDVRSVIFCSDNATRLLCRSLTPPLHLSDAFTLPLADAAAASFRCIYFAAVVSAAPLSAAICASLPAITFLIPASFFASDAF
jgi:hypothetical protein